jgi:hypothetical protein
VLAAAATVVGVWRLGGAPLLGARSHPDALITDAGNG